jgi:hypothetical protein
MGSSGVRILHGDTLTKNGPTTREGRLQVSLHHSASTMAAGIVAKVPVASPTVWPIACACWRIGVHKTSA